jgi:hypothetical protein
VPAATPGREPRGSLQKLLEEKKVGRILGFFETLSKPAASGTTATGTSPTAEAKVPLSFLLSDLSLSSPSQARPSVQLSDG